MMSQMAVNDRSVVPFTHGQAYLTITQALPDIIFTTINKST